MKFILRLCLLFLLLNVSPLAAADGDTTVVKAHQQVDLTWYKSYRDWAVFPDATNDWQEVMLKYTMGCASGGCSDWDYTTLINLMIPTGALDSNIASIDTISQSPLVIDTSWNVFQVKERYELCKVITPYGGALGNDWTRTFYFDVSDYYPLLRDSVEIEVFYQGWSSGFSATLDFIMTEGAPIRDVHSIENLYRGKFNYITTAAFESTHMPARALNLHPMAQHFNLKMAPSGHGFINALNCAEFCVKDYYVKVDGAQVAQQSMWRDDCGLNGLYPQAGTWLYDRANWCPGDRVNIYDHELDLAGHDSIDVDIEPYVYTVPANETPANYNMSATLFQLGDFNRNRDLALDDILWPSDKDEYARFNPICSEARIRIRNEGGDTINAARIVYGIKGAGIWQRFNWTGSLAPLQSVEIELPMDSLKQWETAWIEPVFVARVEFVDGQVGDEFAGNDEAEAKVKLADRLPPVFRFELRTNNAASETFWRLEDADGNILYSGDNLSNSTTYRDTFNLSPGCYMLLIGDRDEDGLSFFANNDGSGRIILRNVGGNFFSENINPNFGTEFRKYFTVGYGLSSPDVAVSPELNCSLFPNPAQDQFKIYFGEELKGELSLELRDIQGRLVLKQQFEMAGETEQMVSLADLKAGIYTVSLQHAAGSWQDKLVIN